MMKERLKYLIIGAGATGGCIAAFLKGSGKDVTLCAEVQRLYHDLPAPS